MKSAAPRICAIGLFQYTDQDMYLLLVCGYKPCNRYVPVSSEGEDGGNASKSEFQGKLSHNPTSPARITRFFPPQVPKTVSSCQPLSPPAMPIVIGRTSPRRHASTMSLLKSNNVTDLTPEMWSPGWTGEIQNKFITKKLKTNPLRRSDIRGSLITKSSVF
ncbi:hypothetical protein J6590_037290 [Homalodisca vitripennis]|nr:hypothetical protein J6590_037290 [Homalodisca vitripennis]